MSGFRFEKPVWKTLASQVLIEGGFVRVRKDQLELPDGRKMPQYFVLEFTPWVNIVATTTAGELVMVEQYRHGLGRPTLEIPGGAVEPGEDPKIGGLRELREETGYAPKDPTRVEILAQHAPNPSLQNNWAYTLWVPGCEQVQKQEMDEFEDVRVHVIPPQQVAGWIDDGTIHHSIVLGSLFIAQRKKGLF